MSYALFGQQVAAWVASIGGGSRLASDYLEREGWAAGEQRFQVRIVPAISDRETDANRAFPRAGIQVLVHHRLADTHDERAWTESAAHDSLWLALLDPKEWISNVERFKKFEAGSDPAAEIDRTGDIITEQLEAVVLLKEP